MLLLILGLLKTNTFIEKKSDRRDIVQASSPVSIKIVLTLLAKVVVFYMQVFII